MSTAINLQRFCASTIDLRECLRKPWAHKGWLYATNGHLMVRMLNPESAESEVTHNPGVTAPGMFDAAGKAGYTELPSFPAPAKCATCEGAGEYLQVKCPDCNGEGQFLHGDFTYDCQRCDQDGWIGAEACEPDAAMHNCPVCSGVGYYRGIFAAVGDSGYDAAYLCALARLPGLRVCTNGDKAMHFTFDGGEGLLMPRRAD